MKRVAEMSDMSAVLRKLPRIKRYLFSRENVRCVCVCVCVCVCL